MENDWFCCIALTELGTPPEKSYGREFIKIEKKNPVESCGGVRGIAGPEKGETGGSQRLRTGTCLPG